MAISTFETLLQDKSISVKHLDLTVNDLSGDMINGGTITNFKSTGITDSATEPVIILTNEEVHVDTTLKANHLVVDGDLRVKNLIYEYTHEELQYDITLNRDQCLRIGNNMALSKTELGKSVINSNLRTVGNLQSLEVGSTMVVNNAQSSVSINSNEMFASVHVGTNAGSELIIDGIEHNSYIGTLRSNDLYFGTNVATKGKTPTLVITTDGTVGIGTVNPQASLDVKGPIRFDGITFRSGLANAETNQINIVGDIIWNRAPRQGKPIGWVCVMEGQPGTWCKFGMID